MPTSSAFRSSCSRGLRVCLRRTGGSVRRGVPAGVDAEFVIGVQIDLVRNVALRVCHLGWTAEAVHYERCDQMQSATRGRAPAAGQVLEIAGARGVDVGDGLGDSAGG